MGNEPLGWWTPRRLAVLSGLILGWSEKEIAVELAISSNTVHGHVTAIYKCFGVTSHPELLAQWVVLPSELQALLLALDAGRLEPSAATG